MKNFFTTISLLLIATSTLADAGASYCPHLQITDRKTKYVILSECDSTPSGDELKVSLNDSNINEIEILTHLNLDSVDKTLKQRANESRLRLRYFPINYSIWHDSSTGVGLALLIFTLGSAEIATTVADISAAPFEAITNAISTAQFNRASKDIEESVLTSAPIEVSHAKFKRMLKILRRF